MYKCFLALEIDVDEDEWMFKDIELPFVPYPDLLISFHEDGRIFDNIVVELIEWEHHNQRFYCNCTLPIGIGRHSSEVAIEEFKVRGWRREE